MSLKENIKQLNEMIQNIDKELKKLDSPPQTPSPKYHTPPDTKEKYHHHKN